MSVRTATKPPANFDGFRPAALQFLADLAANQSKPWFEANRSRYERDLVAPLRALVADLSAGFARRGVPLSGDPMKALFRIHRDVRFSHDKSPYKTNAGAVLSRGGAKDRFGVFYLHLAPAGCFCAVGFWQPEPAWLEALRRAMQDEPGRVLAAVAALEAAGAALMRDDALTRLPRGFESGGGTPIEPLLKLRSLAMSRPIAAEALEQPALVSELEDFAEAARPLLQFGWDAL